MNWINLFAFLLMVLCDSAQITRVKVVYERKTNLFKKYKEERTQRWIKEENKIKVDMFDLIVSDSLSVFKPQESELRDQIEWAIQKNTTYQNTNAGKRFLKKNLWGEELLLTDSLVKRSWKITESGRKIAGYNCRKAIWQANDSTKIYAWFSYDILPQVGPESYCGLPGLILGLATEDGGIIYFAKKVEVLASVEPSELQFPKKKKVKQVDEVKKDMEGRFGKEKWFKSMWNEEFYIW
jgi:GLPGLI family protein